MSSGFVEGEGGRAEVREEDEQRRGRVQWGRRMR